ncbi:hypothetical protein [Paenibacillus sp. 1P07SE]|uniref:hypothetical protein n=1 Tax=Paenibacillus sp. 1P07SE TaxID=3132209 RepID=UPI0039A4A6A2
MKLSKKAISVAAFALGACVFVSTALADLAVGTGYDRLKATTKHTAAQLANGLDNYTFETSFTLKSNGNVLQEMNSVSKYDTVMQTREETSTTKSGSGEITTRYSYSDKERAIWQNSFDEKYYVTEYGHGWNAYRNDRMSNPFEQDGAAEVERIIDAVIGNLKEQVQVDEVASGAVTYSGSLSEAQVPSLVNAVASFGVKQFVTDQARLDLEQQIPKLTSDVFVKKVTGTAVEDEAGLLKQLTGELILSGKDSAGVLHEISISAIFSLVDVGTTVVTAPDLTDASVETVGGSGFSSMHEGTYRNDIVMEKNGALVKIGERTLIISSVDGNTISGSYSEDVRPEFLAAYGDEYKFTFEHTFTSSNAMNFITYTNPQGEQEQGQLSLGSLGRVYLQLNIEVLDEYSYRSNDQPYYNGDFNRVFED